MCRYDAQQSGATWVLASIEEQGNSYEEFVSTFHGVICKMELPPFTEKIKLVVPAPLRTKIFIILSVPPAHM
jgi:hypothetical protein